MTIGSEKLAQFKERLIEEEKADATVRKYIRDVGAFAEWLQGRALDKCAVLDYKTLLCRKYAPASVNAALASLNSYFAFISRHDLRVKNLKIQRQLFIKEEKELTKREYESLLAAAKTSRNERLYLLLQTICSTGIRVSEVCFITAEAVRRCRAEISSKGKYRYVFLSKSLSAALKKYMKATGIKEGPIFVTKSGKPLDRSNIWSDMKKLCKRAGVSERKVFPHNLRHLFARTFYTIQKDIVRLADILGHSSVNTTRIYTAESGAIHSRQLERIGSMLC